jgi:hypothetical protein
VGVIARKVNEAAGFSLFPAGAVSNLTRPFATLNRPKADPLTQQKGNRTVKDGWTSQAQGRKPWNKAKAI